MKIHRETMYLSINFSARGRSFIKDMSPLMHADFSTRGDRYDPETNPGGHINMGTAETHLINNEVISFLENLSSRLSLHPSHIHYDYFHGSVEFRAAIAAHWQKIIFGSETEHRLTEENVVVGAGCSLALEMLATMLGDPGDVFLIPAPYYSGFKDDIQGRMGIIPVGVHCDGELSIQAFEEAYAQQSNQGKRVKAVLFSSPNNPTGKVYSAAAVQGLIRFCMDKDIDLISDEIYAQTIHDPQARFLSTLRLTPDEYLHRVHITSSFAKDFALSGFRTGFALSFNPDMILGMRGLAYYSSVSTHTQALLTDLLRAPELPGILDKNRNMLHQAYLLMQDCLKEMEVEVLPAQGGIFLFANFGTYLKDSDFKSEYVLWEEIFKGLKINISPGQLFDASAPGWFRICYAHEPSAVEEACRRLHTIKSPYISSEAQEKRKG